MITQYGTCAQNLFLCISSPIPKMQREPSWNGDSIEKFPSVGRGNLVCAYLNVDHKLFGCKIMWLKEPGCINCVY